MDHDKFNQLIKQLYSTVSELEAMFPERHFTPDGHMVGSIGECLVADAYGLVLKKASNKGFDATATDGSKLKSSQLNQSQLLFVVSQSIQSLSKYCPMVLSKRFLTVRGV